MSKKSPKKLVIEYDVTDLGATQIKELTLEAVVQGEASDGKGGKRYNGKTGHPDTPVLGTRVVEHSRSAADRRYDQPDRRSTLVVEFDVTGLTKDQIGWLASEAVVQAERSDGHPGVTATSKVVAR